MKNAPILALISLTTMFSFTTMFCSNKASDEVVQQDQELQEKNSYCSWLSSLFGLLSSVPNDTAAKTIAIDESEQKKETSKKEEMQQREFNRFYANIMNKIEQQGSQKLKKAINDSDSDYLNDNEELSQIVLDAYRSIEGEDETYIAAQTRLKRYLAHAFINSETEETSDKTISLSDWKKIFYAIIVDSQYVS